MKKKIITQVLLVVSLHLRCSNQGKGMRRKELSKMYSKLSIGTIYRHANKLVADKTAHNRKRNHDLGVICRPINIE